MACLRKLKDDIRELETIFPKRHERFRVNAASVDELTFEFVVSDTDAAAASNSFGIRTVVVIHANIMETYPMTAPVWFSDRDHALVTHTLAWLSDHCHDNHVLVQVFHLITRLCHAFDMPLPSDLARLPIPVQKDDAHTSDLESDNDDLYEMEAAE